MPDDQLEALLRRIVAALDLQERDATHVAQNCGEGRQCVYPWHFDFGQRPRAVDLITPVTAVAAGATTTLGTVAIDAGALLIVERAGVHDVDGDCEFGTWDLLWNGDPRLPFQGVSPASGGLNDASLTPIRDSFKGQPTGAVSSAATVGLRFTNSTAAFLAHTKRVQGRIQGVLLRNCY